MTQNHPAADREFNIILQEIFTLLVLVGVFRHEIWLDEAQNWLQARDNVSLYDLILSIRYEGHPVLWNALLFMITRFSHDVFWMQLLHAMLACVVARVIITGPSFSKLQRVLLVFGYFFFYEYAVISRNYVLTVLFALLFITQYVYKPFNRKRSILLLVVLANTHVFGFLFAFVLMSVMLFEKKAELKALSTFKAILSGGILVAGFGLSLLQIVPPGNTPIVNNPDSLSLMDYFSRSIPLFVKAFIPIPDLFNYNFWNTTLVIALSKPVAVVLSLVILMLPLFFFWNKRVSLVMFYGGALLLLIVIVFVKLQAVRYAGMLYVLFVLSYIHALQLQAQKTIFPVLTPVLQNKIFTVLLFVQAMAGVVAFSLEISRPFSESRNVAEYVKKGNFNAPVIVGEFCESATILCYMDQQAYYLNLKNYGSYCHLKNGLEVYNVPIVEELEEARRFARGRREDVLFIHYRPLEEQDPCFQLIKSFTNSVVRNENFYIYKVHCPV